MCLGGIARGNFIIVDGHFDAGGLDRRLVVENDVVDIVAGDGLPIASGGSGRILQIAIIGDMETLNFLSVILRTKELVTTENEIAHVGGAPKAACRQIY